MIRSRLPRGRRRSRGAAMLEFALILPMFIYICLLCIDLGHLVLMSGTLQDATFVAARNGAQAGGGGFPGNGASYTGFMRAMQSVPGYNTNDVESFDVASPTCTSAGAGAYVQVTTQYRVSLITPGLGSLLGLAGGNQALANAWTVKSTAVARCEIVQ